MGLDLPTASRLVRHPRTGMAVKASIAASAAWVVARQIPGAAEYALYAPFGAVATTYSAVARSASATVRTLAAIMVGAGLGVLVALTLGHGVAAVAVAVGVGIVVAGVPWFGENRSYVPVAAMFVLLIGEGDQVRYAASYAGLFLLGAAFTLVVNAVAPSLPVEPADTALDRLRGACADHLGALAAALDPADAVVDPPDESRLTRALVEARAAVDEMREAARANRRARRHPGAVARRADDFRALQRAVLLVDDLQTLSRDAPWGTTVDAVPDQLRIPMAAALRELATTTAEAAWTDTEAGRRRSADQALARLAAELRAYETAGGSPAVTLVVASVLTTLRRSLSALTPDDRIPLSASPLADVGDDRPRALPGSDDALLPGTGRERDAG